MRMALSLAVVTIALSGPVVAQDLPNPTPIFEVSSAGARQALDEARELKVKFWLQQLMLSALYGDAIFASSAEEWQRLRWSPSRIHWRFPSTQTLAIPERRVLTFEQVLLPFPPGRHYPADIFIRTGDSVLRLTKYDPWVLQKLISESGLPPIDSLSNIERALF